MDNRNRRRDARNQIHASSETPRKLRFQWLAKITGNFAARRRIGSGGFGVVYKGILPNGEVLAVKRLKNTLEVQDRQFENEVNHLMGLEHKHIVRLVGYCREIVYLNVREHRGRFQVETPEKLLCFEYMPNGSLDSRIYDISRRPSWRMCYKIIKGICWGLYYLHDANIIHLDLKPGNVLLDGNMVPKITDFGLSRLFGENQTRVHTSNVVGTIGYMAPEYLNTGEITTRSDIYSLGVLILEIVTGEKNRSEDGAGLQYVNNVRNNWKKSLIASRYPSLGNDRLREVEWCVALGLCCVERDPSRRPTVRQVIHMLTGLKIDQSLWLDTSSPGKYYMLPARSLDITWSSEAKCWRWQHVPNSRFECARLLEVYWLQISGKIGTKSTFTNPQYMVYLVYMLAKNPSGLQRGQKATISLGGRVISTHTVCLDPRTRARARARGAHGDDVIYPVTRSDGWMEVKLGEFVNSSGEDNDVTAVVRDTNDNVWKKGLIIEGMEIRPAN